MPGPVLRVAQGIALGAVVLLLGLLVWKVAFAGGDTVTASLERGDTPVVPDVTLSSLDGEGTFTFDSLRGKAVLVNFWASWCVPCKDEAPLLERTWRTYRDRGLVVLGVNARDVREDARRFVERFSITYPIVVDKGDKALTRFGVTGFPETFLIDREGKVVGDVLVGGLDVERNKEKLPALIELALGGE